MPTSDSASPDSASPDRRPETPDRITSNNVVPVPASHQSGIQRFAEFAWLSFQPATAWAAIFALMVVTTVGIAAGAGSIIRLLFPVAAVAVGMLLFQLYPMMYVSYAWWIWFITPFLRRLIDHRAGYEEPNVILLAPFLVSALSGILLYKRIPRIARHGGMPFLMALAALGYGLIVSLINSQGQPAYIALLKWASPILLGLFIFFHWREYPAYSRMIRHTFLWMVIITGAYGIYQYVIAPPWDTFWLTESGMISSGGKAEAYGMRVFSTMNSTGPFANVMSAGLILLFSNNGPLKLPASGIGYLAFLTTLVRGAWVSWVVALLTLISSLKPKFQMRLFLVICGMLICVLPLTLIEPFGTIIGDRLSSLTNLSGDTSYNGRVGIYQSIFPKALNSLIGLGLAGPGEIYDSAFVDTLFALGWIGTLPYFIALLLALYSLFKSEEARYDQFFSATKAICLGAMVTLLFGSAMLEISGTILWGFIGIGLAANRYYIEQKFIRSRQPFPPPQLATDRLRPTEGHRESTAS